MATLTVGGFDAFAVAPPAVADTTPGAPGAVPTQLGGDASGLPDTLTTGRNLEVPPSTRTKFPTTPLAKPVTPQNSARTEAVPAAPFTGYDAKTSREIVARRTATTRTFANTDGTETTQYSNTVLNVQDGKGRWAVAAPTVTRDGGAIVSSGTASPVRIADRGDAAQVASVDLGAGRSVAWGLDGARPAAATTAAAAASFADVLPGVSLELAPQAGGVKETLVLASAATPRRFTFPLRLQGVQARLSGDAVDLVDAKGVVVATIPAGSMVDSAAGATGPATSTGVRYSLTGQGANTALVVDVDGAWLSDPARVYPVRVDPSVDTTKVAVTSVDKTGSRGTTSSFELGPNNGQHAAVLTFPEITSTLAYQTIYGVQLTAATYGAPSCSPRPVTVSPVTAAVSSGTTVSSLSTGPTLASASMAYGYVEFGASTSACNPQQTAWNLGSAGRDLVKGWVDKTSPNYGLALQTPNDALAHKQVVGLVGDDGKPSANPPSLYVTHSPYNADYSIPNPTPTPPVLQNQDGKVKVTVTNKSAEAWAPGTYYLAYRAFLDGVAKGQQRSAELSATVPRGGSVTLDATIKQLPAADEPYVVDFTMVKSGGPVFTDEQVPPGRLLLKVTNIPPVVQQLYPPNGYQAPTLTPQLFATAVDLDTSAGVAYRFTVCPATGDCTTPVVQSAWQPSKAWTVPANTFRWNQAYSWYAEARDGQGAVTTAQPVGLGTEVPQPAITANLAGAPGSDQQHEFDPIVGNYSTAAVDAPVTTSGPSLAVSRVYNSLDPRTSGAFGAGWSTLYDMRVASEGDGTGNLLVTLPDGQTVRFGKNPDGTFVGPRSRQELLTLSGTRYTLRDAGGSSYLFNDNGTLSTVRGMSGRALQLTYDASNGKLKTATSGNSSRYLTFTWTGSHVTSVSTTPVNGVTPTWTYTYSGNSLTKVCAADSSCTTYAIGSGSHYRSAVADAKPDSYWRLGDPTATAGAMSEVGVNLGKDAGTYVDVTAGAAGALAGTADTAVTLNGTSSRITLPAGTAKKSRDMAVELWFKTSAAGSPQPLLGYQSSELTATPTSAAPILYVGSDGRLRGQLWTGTANPITTGGTVNDGAWHHVVLSANAGVQTLYLDAAKVGSTSGTIDQAALTYDQAGAAYAMNTSAWPGWQNTLDPSKTTNRAFFKGSLDEISIYSHPLGPDQVAAHRALGTSAAAEMTTVTLASGAVASNVAYDNSADRVDTYTDRNGGNWKVGRPLVAGDDTDLRRSVLVRDPAGRPWLYEYDALSGQLLRTGSPQGLGTRPEDTQVAPVVTPPSSPVCTKPDPNDPGFCTYDTGTPGDPTFVTYDASGMGIRSYEYDDQGRLTTIVDEHGDAQSMTYDERQNVVTRKPCRSSETCPVSYSTFPTGLSDPLDPRWNKPTDLRDARSSGPTDNTYRTSYTYTAGGDILTQRAADGATVTTAYTAGNEVGADNGTVPSGLPASSRDARGATTTFTYNGTGDLAKIVEPSGLVTTFTYDAVGRKITQTEKSDTYPNGVTTTYSYDTMSRLLSTTDPATSNGVTGVAHQQKTAQVFDVDGRVSSSTVTDVMGNDPARTTTYEYDEHGRLVAVVDPTGGRTTYTFDVFGNTMSTTTADGTRWQYSYSARNSLTATSVRDIDANGSDTTTEVSATAYDETGRVAAQRDAMGRTVRWAYWPDGTVKTKTLEFRDPGGDTSKNRDYVLESDTYDAAGNLLTQVTGNGTTTTAYTRDAVGRTATMTLDPNGTRQKVTYTYDLAGNATKVETTGNASNLPVASTAQTRTTTSVYDPSNRVTSQTVAATATTALTTQFGYDQRGFTTSVVDPRGTVSGADASKYRTDYTYDQVGRMVGMISPPVGTEQYGVAVAVARPTTATGYDTFGETVSLQDPLGRVAATTYDKLGRVATSTSPSYTQPGQTNPIVATTTNTYDPVGRLTASTDPTGTTRFGYDRLGHQVSVDTPAASDTDRAVTQYAYTRTGLLLSTTDPLGAVRSATYDDLDRTLTATVSERRPAAVNLTTTMAYDDANNLVSTTSPTGATTTSTYDAAGQLLTATDPNGVRTSWSYDGFGDQVRMTDALGRASSTTYDLAGRQTRTADIAPTGGELRVQTFAYDPAGNLTSATPATGNPTTFGYDANNNVVSQTEPVTASSTITTSFGYDAAGQRTRYTDGRGNASYLTYNSWDLPESMVAPSTPGQTAASARTWTTTYDAAGRQTQVKEPGAVTQKYTYDAAGNVLTATGSGAEATTPTKNFTYDKLGQVLSQSAPTGTNSYTYDDRGDALSAAGPGGTATFRYDGDGQLTKRVDGSGTATFGYDKGRLASQVDPVTATSQTFAYDATGAPKTVTYNSGRTRSFTYDDLGRLATDTLRSSSTGTPTISSIGYGYDLDNHVTSKTTTGTAGAGANTYAYDLAGRLTSWKSPTATTTYGWDASSNRTSVNGVASSFDARNRLISDGTSDYSYTARGTMQSKTTGSQTENFVFDAFDRMVSDGSSSYAYDSFDRTTTANGATMQYSGGDDDAVSDGSQVFGRGVDGDVVSVAQGSTKRSVLTDQHGDVVAGFDPTNTTSTTLTDSKAFNPWGGVTAKTGTSFALGYQGDWTDATTGEVDMGARWYDTASGTFDSQDTVQYSSGPSALANKYLYGAGDPVTNNDPTGNWPHCGFCSRAIHAVSSAVSNTVSTVSHYASSAWSTATHYASVAWDYAKRAASAAWNVVKTVVSAVAAGASWLYNKAKSAVSAVAGAVSSAAHWVAGKVTQGVNWAKEKAQQAAAAAHAAAVKVTQATKAAITYAVQHNPLPAIAAVVKPLYEGVKTVVSAVASIPAAVVAITVDVVQDTITAAQAVYHAAVTAAGAVVTAVSTAVSAAGDFVADHWKTIVAVAAGIAVGLACTAVTAGAGAAACFIAGGALVGALSNSLNCPPGKSIAGCAAKGAVAGGIGAAITVATGGAGGVLVTALGAAGGAAAEDASLQYLNTGHVDATEVVTSAAIGGAAGAAGAKLRGGCNCFAAGTEVKTDAGDKPIEKIAVGDKVWAKDLASGKNELRTVKSLFRKTATAMMALVVAGSTVAVTTEHPFYTADRGWVESGDLKVGEHLVTVNGSDATVESITYENKPTTVYNFEVDGDHNYYIGASSLLVHNCEQIAYNSDELSSAAHTARVDAGVSEYRNVAAARVDGISKPVIGISGDGRHAEQQILDRLTAQGVDHGRISAIYTDRQPCAAVCSPALRKALRPGVPVTYAVPYGANQEINNSASLLLQFMIRKAGR